MTGSIDEIWKQVVVLLDKKIDRHNIETWILPAKALGLEEPYFTIGVPSKFFATWLEEHHSDIIRDALRQVAGREFELRFSILSSERPPPEATTDPVPAVVERRSVIGTNINPRYTFKRFVVGGSNKFAHAAARDPVP